MVCDQVGSIAVANQSSNRNLRKKIKKRKLSYESRILLLAFLGGLPATVVSLILLWGDDYSTKVEWTLTILIVGFWLGFAAALRERVVMPLQTLSNLLSALREEDYSLRARGASHDDAMGEVFYEANELSETMREQRLGAEEATALLRKVMAEIDVAIFAFDAQQRLRLINRAGEKLINQPPEGLLGRDAADLGLDDCLEGEPMRTLERSFPGRPTDTVRWGLRRGTFRERGLPHQLLVLEDISQPLREEERQAWQRLIRVLGHELNNSLAPIKSMAGTLESLLMRPQRPSDWEVDMRRGLEIMKTRADALSRFMEAYARLARLPQPRFQPVQIGELLRRVAEFESRLSVELMPGPQLTIRADADQVEQLVINLVKNAVDAALESGGEVKIGWKKNARYLEVWVQDNGPGPPNTTNLFVPFFTTKPQGSGIGLVLSRQIAEAHGGTLILENRKPKAGCVARLRLPLS
jgi:two-component system, NtrC family, nitrogen regulation sensor histidine kinase NtrY